MPNGFLLWGKTFHEFAQVNNRAICVNARFKQKAICKDGQNKPGRYGKSIFRADLPGVVGENFLKMFVDPLEKEERRLSVKNGAGQGRGSEDQAERDISDDGFTEPPCCMVPLLGKALCKKIAGRRANE